MRLYDRAQKCDGSSYHARRRFNAAVGTCRINSRGGVAACWVILPVIFCTLAAMCPQARGGEPLREYLPKILPWMEANVPLSPMDRWYPEPWASRPPTRVIDHCLTALGHWATITDVAIVTTKPGQTANLYPELMERKPDGLFIIGGLKTYILQGTSPEDARPYDFADSVGWRRIADEARSIVRITRTNVVLLENETALTPYHAGKETIDLAKLGESLRALRETGIQFWWNLPIILDDTRDFPDREKQTALLLTTISEALPDSIFIEGYTMWNGWQNNRHTEVDRRRKMIGLVGPDRVQERLIVTPDGYWHYATGRKKRAYTPAEAIEMSAKLLGRAVSVYPQGTDAAELAKKFVRQFKALRPDGH